MGAPIGMLPLDTENGVYNLTTPAGTGPTVLTHTPDPDGSRNCRVVLIVGGLAGNQLDGTGGDFTLTINSNGVPWNAGSQTHTLGTAARAMIQSETFTTLPGLPVTVQLLSPNGADTAVEVTAYLFDAEGNALSLLENNRYLTQASTQRDAAQGRVIYVDPVAGATYASGARGRRRDPLASVQDAHDNLVADGERDTILLTGPGPLTEQVTLTKSGFSILGPGADFLWNLTSNGDVITVTGSDVRLSNFRLETHTSGGGIAMLLTGAASTTIDRLTVTYSRNHAVSVTGNASLCRIHDCKFGEVGAQGSGHGVVFTAGNAETMADLFVERCQFHRAQGDGVRMETTGSGTITNAVISNNSILDSDGYGINITAAGSNRTTIDRNVLGGNATGAINDAGTLTISENNEQWAKAGTTNTDLDETVASVLASAALQGTRYTNLDEIATAITGNRWYVNNLGGSDLSDGDRAAPLQTIQSALTQARPGDVIHVEETGSDYVENLTYVNQGVTVVGEGRPLLRPGSGIAITCGQANCGLANFDVYSNDDVALDLTGAIYFEASDCWCETDGQKPAINAPSARFLRLTRCKANSPWIGIDLDNSKEFRIRECNPFANANGPLDHAYGVRIQNSSQGTFYNCSLEARQTTNAYYAYGVHFNALSAQDGDIRFVDCGFNAIHNNLGAITGGAVCFIGITRQAIFERCTFDPSNNNATELWDVWAPAGFASIWNCIVNEQRITNDGINGDGVYQTQHNVDVVGTLATLDDLENLSSADVAAALQAIGLHYLVSQAPAGPGLIGDGTVLADMADLSGTWANFDPTLHSLRAIRERGDVAWITGTGGGGGLTVGPLQTTVQRPQFSTFGGTLLDLEIAQHSSGALLFSVHDGDGNPVNLTGKTCNFTIYDNTTDTTHHTITDVTIGGAEGNEVTVNFDETQTAVKADWRYGLWNADDRDLLASGRFWIKRVAYTEPGP